MPTRYIPYIPEPLRGQAVLNTFTRALRYAGNDQVLRNGLPHYETLAAEVHGDPDAAKQNLLVHGDCLSTCALLRDRGIRVDLVYIDPPFASGADYAKKIVLRPNPLAPASAAEVDNPDADFDEKMYGDIWEKERYLNWMYDNLSAIKSVMAEDAAIYVHLDWHIGHYVKVMLDEIFGEDNFVNEIVWCYTGPSPVKGHFPRKHDTIFWYAKNIDSYTFNEDAIRLPYKAKFTQARGVYGVNDKTEEEQRAVFARGKVPEDWWADMSNISSYRDELVNYATQKPEALLERIIKASSNEGMLVADFFGGSGTTAAVATRLGRRFVTCDVNRNAIQTMRDRLVAQGTAFVQEEIQDGVELYRNPAQTMEKLCELVPGLHRLTEEETAMGMKREFWFGAINDPKLGRMPVWMPNLLEGSGRVLGEPTVRHALYKFLPLLQGEVSRAIFFYVDTETSVENLQAVVRRENERTTIDVEFRDLRPYLEQAILHDDADWELTEDSEGLMKGWRLRLIAFRSDRLVKTVEELNTKASLQPSAKGRQAIALSDNGLEGVEWMGVDARAEGPWQSAAEVRIEPSGTVTRNDEKTKERWDATLFCEGPDRPRRLKIRSILGDETMFNL